MSSMQWGSIRRWFSLVRGEGESLVVRIPRAVWEKMIGDVTAATPFVRGLKQQHTLPSFIPPQMGVWGFGEWISSAVSESDGDVVDCSCVLPTMRTLGEDAWPQMRAFIASLMLLFAALELYELLDVASVDGEEQLILVTPLLKPSSDGVGGFPIIATLSPAVVSWMRAQLVKSPSEQTIRLPPVEARMRSVYEHVMGSDAKGEYFMALLALPCKFVLKVPGNACTLTSDHALSDTGGMDLSPHNVDYPAQQLAFLMGLVALTEMVMP